MKTCLIFLMLSTISLFGIGQERQRVPDKEIKDIIQLAIDLPELQPYFHADLDSGRVPLVIKEFGQVNAKNLSGIQKFGHPIQVLNGHTIEARKIEVYLNIGDWTYGNNHLRLQMDYLVEGIFVNYSLERINGQWEITDSLIMED